MSGCRRCESDLEHCHGTLVRHDDGSVECSSVECSTDPQRSAGGGSPCTGNVDVHDVVVWCDQERLGCCQQVPAAEELPIADVA